MLSLDSSYFNDLFDDPAQQEPADIHLDVPFVPTDEAMVEAMLKLAEVGRRDVLYDLGSGDGRIVVEAALQRHIRSVGIELDPLRVAEAMEYAALSRVEHLVDFIEDDIFTAEIGEATIVTLYLLQSVNVKLRSKLLSELRPGTRVISHAFDMGDWQADERRELSGTRLYKWIIPAQVAGQWEWEGLDGTPYHLELTQRYQMVKGRVWEGDDERDLKRATLTGNTLRIELQGSTTTSRKRFTLIFEDKELDTIYDTT